MARKTEYDPNRHPRMAKALARDGYTDKEMAAVLGISVRTLNRWKKSHQEFMNALTIGKTEVDLQVEDSLLKRALGYEYEETEIIVSKDAENAKPARVKRIKKHITPDVTACIFWLKNRQPSRWRDKQENVTQPVDVNVYVKALEDAASVWSGDEDDEQ